MHKHTDICICIDLYTYICIYTSTATTNLHRQTGALQVFVVAEEGAHALEPNLCRRTHVCAEKSDSDPRCRPAAGSWRVSEGQRAHAAALPRCSPRHRFAPRPGTWRPRTPGSVPCPRRAKKSVATPGVAPPPEVASRRRAALARRATSFRATSLIRDQDPWVSIVRHRQRARSTAARFAPATRASTASTSGPVTRAS